MRIAPKLLLLKLQSQRVHARRMSVTPSRARPVPRSEPMGWTPPPGDIDASFKRQEYASERNEVVPIWYLKIWTEAARGDNWNHKVLLCNN